jgi:hypothetical protein
MALAQNHVLSLREQFPHLRVVFPTPEEGAFQLCRALDVNQQRHSDELRGLFQDDAFKIKANLRKHPTAEGKYLASLHVPSDGSVASANNNCRLESGTRVQVLLKLAGQPATHQFRDMVVDDAGTGLKAILVLDEPGTNLDKHSPAEDLATEEFLAAVECIEDPTPTRRWMATIRAITKDRSHKKGVDIKHLVLQSPPTISGTGSMAIEAGVDPHCKAIIDRIVEERKLKSTQIDAVKLACTTETGLATIYGLPDTGKTPVLGTIGEIQVEIGKQIQRCRCGLAVAPSNLALEQLAESIINGNPQKMECVWYMGSHLPNEKEKDELNEQEDLKAAMRPLGTLVEEDAISSADSTLFDIGFHQKRLIAFTRWTATPEHPMATKAEEYLHLLNKLQIAKRTQRAPQKEHNDRLHVLEEECSAHYLQNEVDMVFCTNGKSAQGLICRYYQPKFILQDNAAEINVPEAATPIAAFVQTVELLIQAGDRTQQRAVPASQGFNELLDMLLKSPMDLISVNSLFERACIEL